MALKRILLSLALLAGCAHAQFLGSVSSQSVAQQVFNAQAANGDSVTVSNLGQSAHFLTYCNTGFSGTISLVASPDGAFAGATTTTLASAAWGQNSTSDSACHVLQSGGYYQSVRARITNYSAGSVKAWYTAIASPISFSPSAFTSHGPGAPIACDQFTVVQQAQSVSNGVLVGLNGTLPSIYVCQMTISFGAATTTGTISFQDGNAGGCVTASGGSDWQLQVTANTPQTITVGGPVGSIFGTLTPGRCLMIVTGAITAPITISASYAQF